MNEAGDRPALTPIQPKAITSSAWAIGGICALLTLAARTTGAGWLVVIMCLLLGGLLVGILAPWIALRGTRLSATAPTDATAGEPVQVTVRSNRPSVGVLVRSAPDQEWGAIAHAGGADVAFMPPFRGVYDTLTIEACCGAPFGLSWRRRKVTVTLRRPLVVAPRTVDDGDTLRHSGEGQGEHPLGANPRGGDQLRSVRDYVRGDPLRLVHWPATARRGELIVKELEAPTRLHVRVLVELNGVQEPDERTTERAMGVIARALGEGHTVELITAEPDGPRRMHVDGHLAAGRQLAFATAGRIPTSGDGADRCVHLTSGGRRQ